MVLFKNLEEIAENKELVSRKCEPGKWCSVAYKTKLGEGRLLVAAKNIKPEPVVFNLNLKGWYKIYVGLFEMRRDNYSFIKLSNDEAYTPLRPAILKPWIWCGTERMEEVFWRCADLTGQQLVLAKPGAGICPHAGLAWIKCEEMSEEEVRHYKNTLKKKNKCVQMHFDFKSVLDDMHTDKEEHLASLQTLKDTNVEFLSLEYAMSYDSIEYDADYIPLVSLDDDIFPCDKAKYTYDELFEEYLTFAHENGFKIYAAERMSMGNFGLPYSMAYYRKNFISNNPQYYCKNREGSTVNVCSYAYEQVWDYVIGNMLNVVKRGFDGVSMIFHRGMHIAFEEPVVKVFCEKYPGVNPHLLPVTDERLHGVWCDFMTGFMRQVRKRMDEVFDRHIAINVLIEVSVKGAKCFGLDVEQWAKEALIDSVAQTEIETYEDLTDCMSDNDSGLIDMEKYKRRLNDFQIIKRNYFNNVDVFCQKAPEFLRLEELYGVKAYITLPWEHTVELERYQEDVVDRMIGLGAKRFLSWNTYWERFDLPEMRIISEIGNPAGVDVPLRQFYRVLSFGDSDISHFNPNWRG